ncbi:azurin [Luteimonas sp. MJ246]|uniref:azurin n=1 Tax=Luteimonas sp. MJ174 TaxID=3129237 RepID=UPI0031BA0826
MNIKLTVLTAACALALSACGDNSAPTPASTATPPPAPADTTPAQTPPAAPAEAATPADTAQAPATAGTDPAVTGCEIVIESNDAMQFNTKSIAIPSSCSDFKITMNHVGKMPVAAMGHNVVITTAGDMAGVVADGMAAGLDADFLKPDDERIIAHTEMIGGGETTSVSFSVSELQAGESYKFFCSFPGHSALMNGTVSVE